MQQQDTAQQGSALAIAAQDTKLPRPSAISNRLPFSTATQTDPQSHRLHVDLHQKLLLSAQGKEQDSFPLNQ